MLYALIVVALFVFHDLWFDAITNDKEFVRGEGDHKLPLVILVITELLVCALILIEVVMHSVAYGLLYMKHLTMVLEAVFVIFNLVLDISMS